MAGTKPRPTDMRVEEEQTIAAQKLVVCLEVEEVKTYLHGTKPTDGRAAIVHVTVDVLDVSSVFSGELPACESYPGQPVMDYKSELSMPNDDCCVSYQDVDGDAAIPSMGAFNVELPSVAKESYCAIFGTSVLPLRLLTCGLAF